MEGKNIEKSQRRQLKRKISAQKAKNFAKNPFGCRQTAKYNAACIVTCRRSQSDPRPEGKSGKTS